MNKKFIQKRTLLRTFAIGTLIFLCSLPFLQSAKVNATSITPTVTGTRSYVYGNNSATDGINGGNPNGIVPFEIIGSPPAGFNSISLRELNFGFPANAGDSSKKFNRITASFLFVQNNSITFSTNTRPIMSARRTSDSQLVQTTCNFGQGNQSAVVVTCEWLAEYSAFNQFYFVWSNNTELAFVSPNSGAYGISLSVIDLTTVSSDDPMLAGQSTIINQNQTIIDQNTRLESSQLVQNQLIQNQTDFLEQGAQNVQSASDSGNQNANNSQQTNENASQNLLQTAGNIIAVFASPATNCSLNADMGNVNLGSINFCQDKPSAIINVIDAVASIIVVFAVFRITKSLVNRFISLSSYGQGGSDG